VTFALWSAFAFTMGMMLGRFLSLREIDDSDT
jgi:hypothetical protein